MKTVLVTLAFFLMGLGGMQGNQPAIIGKASWYGEAHRGKLMANGKKFDPDKLTAASWFYPLGTKVRVSSADSGSVRSVQVIITDRGPAGDLVRAGRIIDLTRSAFKRLAHPESGLIKVTVEPLKSRSDVCPSGRERGGNPFNCIVPAEVEK